MNEQPSTDESGSRFRSLRATFAAAGAVAMLVLGSAFARAQDAPAADAAAAQEQPAPAEAEPAPPERPSHEEAVDFIEALVRDAFFAVSDETIPEPERNAQFRSVLAEGLAIEFLGEFMLGDHRERAGEEELAEYRALFPDYIMQVYAEQIGKITRNKLTVTETADAGRRDVIVRTELERAGDKEPIFVDWRVRRMSDGKPRVINITANGVSIMIVKRAEFSDIIRSSGMPGLLSLLREKVQQS